MKASSTASDCRPAGPWLKTSDREFADHDGFCPDTRITGGTLPSAAITQMLKSPICDVKAIHLPSGDQSGSVGLETAPPPAGILARRRRSRNFVAKQIHSPSGDQQGEESSIPVVRRFKSDPLALQTHTFGLPDLLKIIATFEPSGETAAPVFKPE